MREKILKAIIYISGFVCLYGLVAIRFLPMYNLVLKEKTVPDYWDKNKYGELYYFNNIRYFREEIPEVKPKFQFSEDHASLEEAEILTFGDSFMDFSRHTQISRRIFDSLQTPVFYEYDYDPIKFLGEKNYNNDEPKILLYTRTERWIPINFGENPITEEIKTNNNPSGPADNEKSSLAKRGFNKIKNLLFIDRADELLKAMLQRSYVISDINEFIATLKFDLFGYVSVFTPRYTLEQETPWLFYVDQIDKDEVTSFYYPHSDQDVATMADNIEKMSKHLWEKYNLQMVFLPVPSKYTIYYHLVDPAAQYNNFIPRLYAELDKRQVTYVNLYQAYKASDEYVFYGTDDHWTEAGVNIATEKVLNKIEEIKD